MEFTITKFRRNGSRSRNANYLRKLFLRIKRDVNQFQANEDLKFDFLDRKKKDNK